jgi:hypothetical protein
MAISRKSNPIRRLWLGAGFAALVSASVWALVGRKRRVDTPVDIASLLGLPVRPRSDWGALPPNHDAPGERGFYSAYTNPGGWRIYDEPLDQILRTVAVHHSATAIDDSPVDLQRTHFNKQRFADIGYHFVIDNLGVIWEGRPINIRGANVSRHNTGTVGICVVGNFERVAPAMAQINALARLCVALRDRFGITHIGGHRDFPEQNTACPGVNLAQTIERIGRDAGLQRL